MTNLTDVSTYNAAIIAPDDGEEITAVANGTGQGPIRPALQRLANRTLWLKDRITSVLNGVLSFKALVVNGTGGGAVTPTDGSLLVSGDSTLTGDVEVGGTFLAAGTYASCRKLIITIDSEGAAVAEGSMTKDLMPFAVAYVQANGTIARNVNVAAHPSSPKPGTGLYRFVTKVCPGSCTGLSDGTEAPIVLQCAINDSAETGRGDNYLYRANAWAKKQTISGSPACVIDVAITAVDLAAGPSLAKTLANVAFSLSIWA
mgnify:FL=1